MAKFVGKQKESSRQHRSPCKMAKAGCPQQNTHVLQKHGSLRSMILVEMIGNLDHVTLIEGTSSFGGSAPQGIINIYTFLLLHH